MSGEKQARVCKVFDRLAGGIFVALVLHLICGLFLERPLNALAGVSLLQALAAVLYLARLTRKAWRPRRTRRFSLHLPVVALIVLPCCFTAVNGGTSFLVALAIFVVFFSHFAFLEAFVAGERGFLSPKGFASLVAGGGALIVCGRLAAQISRAWAANLPWYNLAPIAGLPMVPFDHLYDLLLVMAFPVAAVAGIAPASRRSRAFWIVSSVAIAVGILLSFSRAAWIAFSVELLLLMLSGMPRRKAVPAAVMLLAVAAMTMFIPGVAQRAASIFSLSHRTNVERIEQWAVAVDLIGRSPFLGHGLGTFGEMFLQARSGTSIWYWCPHNLYLHIAVECGIPALFVFIAWISDFLRRAPSTRAAAFSGSGTWRETIRYGGIVAFWGLLCYGLFDL